MSFDTEALGYEDTIQFGEKFTNTMTERFGTYLEKAALQVIDKARSNLQNNQSVSTGALLASIRVLSVEKNGFEITVGSDLEYSKYVEYGRGPVSAKTAKALSWVDPISGKRIFVKRVGPADPHPFLEPAVIEVMAEYPSVVTEKEADFVGGIV